MADNTDTINSIELLVKSMASTMKGMETKVKGFEKMEEAIVELNAKVDRQNTTRRVRTAKATKTMDSETCCESTTQTIAHTITHGITNPDEAAVPAISAICRELIRLTNEYIYNTENYSARNEIELVSKKIAPKPALRSFLCLTKDISLSLAQQIIQEMGSEKGKDTTPARIVALKTGLITSYRDYLNNSPLFYDARCPLEYRSLIDFLDHGCEWFANWPRCECYDHETMLAGVLGQIQESQSELNGFDLDDFLLYYRRDMIEPRPSEHIRYGCINGFRDLSANDFPDPEKFACVEREMAVVCGCNDCELSLPELRKRKHGAID
jgi:hypothetical protein